MDQRAALRIGLVLALAVFAALILRSLFIATSVELPPPQPVPVQVASARLVAGTLLKADDLSWRDVPAGEVAGHHIVKGSDLAHRLPGAVVRRTIDEGAPVTLKDLVLPDAPGFLAAALSPDMRAVSVAIDDVTGNAGLILPGDRVDLILTQRLDGEDGRGVPEVAGEAVLVDVRVIAVGAALRVPDPNDGSTAARPAKTVTLEVHPRETEKVAVAARLGQLSLALRSLASLRPDQEGAVEERGIWADQMEGRPIWGRDVSAVVRMSGSAGAAERRPATPQARVMVFRGSERGDGPAPPEPGR